MKRTLALLMLVWSISNAMAYDDVREFPLTAKKWGINGPVKTYNVKKVLTYEYSYY